jgi:mannose-6-phosphate isomerase-like protein (cupin superfamily)
MNSNDVQMEFLAAREGSPGVFLEDFASNETGILPFDGCRFTVAAGESTIREFHSEGELWLVCRGHGVVVGGDKQVLVEAGSAVRFLPNTTHYVQNLGAEEMLLFALWWTPSNSA